MKAVTCVLQNCVPPAFSDIVGKRCRWPQQLKGPHVYTQDLAFVLLWGPPVCDLGLSGVFPLAVQPGQAIFFCLF